MISLALFKARQIKALFLWDNGIVCYSTIAEYLGLFGLWYSTAEWVDHDVLKKCHKHVTAWHTKYIPDIPKRSSIQSCWHCGRGFCLMFCGLCIVIYLHNNNQQIALFYSQLISIINLYMFRAGLLLIIRSYFPVNTAIDNVPCVSVDWLLAGSQWIQLSWHLSGRTE